MGYLLKQRTITSKQIDEYVDLGLPSGLLWARCNIGAEKPTDCGDYFMWGSTEPDTDKSCNWKNCPFNDGKSEFNKEYFKSIKNKVCPNGILAPEYDAASIIMGDDWRLPTKEDFYELLSNTDNKWVDDYYDSGIGGRIFKSKINDNEIFIPSTGCRFNSYTTTDSCATYLWSSSLYENTPYYSYNMEFNHISYDIYKYDHFIGCCMRAVHE